MSKENNNIYFVKIKSNNVCKVLSVSYIEIT